jgi:hypothetical protein
MARTFATHIAEELQWYSPWSFGFDGSIFALDYRSSKEFVHELPENFDLVNRLGGVYAWDGADVWVNDPALVSLYEHTTNEYLTSHLPSVAGPFAGVAGCTASTCGSGDIFTGVATYNEQANHPLRYAADALAAQYAANGNYL